MVVGACRHRGETAGVVVIESGSPGCEGVEDGCVDDIVSVSSDLISSESVGGDPDDVHVLFSLSTVVEFVGYAA